MLFISKVFALLHPALASSGPADSDQIATNKQDSILCRPFSCLNVENV